MIDKYYRGEYEPFNREDFLAGVLGALRTWLETFSIGCFVFHD